MKKERLDVVWQTAYRLFLSSSVITKPLVTTSDELAAIAVKEQTEALAKRCYWAALHAIEVLDNEHQKTTKRIKK